MSQFKLLKWHNAEAKTYWGNVVKMGLESTNYIKAVQAAVKVSCTITLEIKEKDRSIIMFNHPESTKNSVERKKDDIEFVLRFINQGLQISEQPVKSCFRLG